MYFVWSGVDILFYVVRPFFSHFSARSISKCQYTIENVIYIPFHSVDNRLLFKTLLCSNLFFAFAYKYYF